ncbi:glycosyltransferase family 2 protein [Methylacidiphilum caldifontis]|uniref:Glycosyl transferase n=1 Tax=Methylacidiphilum caldifontis TaxID=2795386 RepID=A0A4Y8PFD0_9BACT|nr:glycosyltransferase family 2 protein [Methylacidiphilum caldifontis]TFE70595.1 glycosyl transferase [Methylacidiphilum caldifontis]
MNANVSIIIVSFNTQLLLEQALTSIENSRDPYGKRVIVFDNGSKDGTEKMIKKKFPWVLYLRSPTNLGFSKAVNQAAQYSQGDYLLLLNSDARLEKDSIQKAVEWMEDHPSCAVCGAQLLNEDGTFQNSIANFPNLLTELGNKSMLRRLFPKKFPGKEYKTERPLAVESVIGAFLLIRKKIWDELKGLDERYFFFFEETDFCLRATKKGYFIYFLPQVKVWHGQGKTAKKQQAEARIEYWKSRYKYFKIHHPFKYWILRIGLLLRLFISLFFESLLYLVTFGKYSNTRLKTNSKIALWHLKGMPDNMGLSKD